MDFKKNINFLIKFGLLLVSFIVSNSSIAIGLGDIKVYSNLNEPLSAEIILTGADELDTNNIIAELASPKDFMRTGIPRPFFLSKLKFETTRNNGVTVIYISTTKAVKNPFLDFLIQLVWPEGKIIKSYTVLLDPQSDNQIRRESPISKHTGLLDNANKANKNNLLNSSLNEPSKNLNLSQQIKTEGTITSDAIFATSLEESSENEVLTSSVHKFPSKNIASIDSHSVPEHHSTAMLATIDTDEQIEKKNVHNNFDNVQDGALTKAVSSLLVFSEQSKRPKINYEKLLDLKPNTIPVHKDAEKLAESIAMKQINSELDSLRNKNSENIEYYQSETTHKEPLVTNTYLELIKKYGNDLLWACFLVSTTIFLFHKMMVSNQSVDNLTPQLSTASNFSNTAQNTKFNEEFVHNHHDVFSNLTSSTEQDELDSLLKQASIRNNDFSLARNEELELKIALTKQYIEAGDRKSAKDILQDITVIKDPKYQDQITTLLKSII